MLRIACCAFVWIAGFIMSSWAEIPESARQDPRFALGYLVVTHYDGVKSDGTGDSTKGLQEAIDDGLKQDMTVLLPAGTYAISDTLRCYKYQLWSAERAERFEGDEQATKKSASTPYRGNHVLIGDATARPVIKLTENAKGFDNPKDPRPLIAFRNYRAQTPAGTQPATADNPMDVPEGFGDATANLFGEVLCNINFDCSGKPGAIGVSMPTAQASTMANVGVNAEGSYAGFYGIPGRNSLSTNLEVQGGQFGLILKGSLAGTVIAGLKLSNQTENAIAASDFVPLAIVGFEIQKSSGPAITTLDEKRMSNGTMSLVDGRIEVQDGKAAIDNSVGKALYLRNVFVKGAYAAVASGSQEPVAAHAGWNRIAEYVYTDQTPIDEDDPPYEVGDSSYRMFSVIDGKVSQEPQPIVSVDAEEIAPPDDIVTRHILNELPLFTGQKDETIVVTAKEYGATANDESDDLPAIQKAIFDAASAGHGRVFLPSGTYRIGKTLELRSNTVLMGTGGGHSEIAAHPSWIPAEGEKAILVRTDDDAQASTTTGFVLFTSPYEPFKLSHEDMLKPYPAEDVLPRNRFTAVQWRAGLDSAMIETRISRDRPPLTLAHLPVPIVHFTGNAGGRHYSPQPRAQGTHRDNRGVMIEGTHEPLTLYGLNSEKNYSPDKSELGGGNPNEWLDANAVETNIEVKNAKNVRIFSVKREGSSPTVIIRDSQNIALFASGAMRNPTHRKMGGYIQVFGDCSNILASTVITQHVKSLDNKGGNEEPMLNEAITGKDPVVISWPESFSIYKRGNFDDSVFATNIK